MPRWRIALVTLAGVGVVAGVVEAVSQGSILAAVVTLGAGAGGIGTLVPRDPRPSERLADEEAEERLAERRERDRREREEAERIERTRGDRHAMMLRDLERMRQAIILEVQKLSPPEPLFFAWGGRRNAAEERQYWVQDGQFTIRFQHGGQGTTWDWPEDGIPSARNQARSYDANNLQDVEQVYALFQLERYLVAANLGEELEADAPGYGRFGASN